MSFMTMLAAVRSNYGGFKYHSDSMFYNSGFCVTSQSLLQFRIFASVFHWLILFIRILEKERLPAFYYLTNIIYLCCAIYYTMAVYNTLNQPERMIPLYHKLVSSSKVFRMDKVCYEEKTGNGVQIGCLIQWFLHSIVLNLSILVSLMYFFLIYNPAKDILGLTNISRHILNSVFILTEFTFNTIIVKFFHVIYALVLAIVYAGFTVLFWYMRAAPENYIYKVVNWDQPGKTLLLVLVLMLAATVVKGLLVLASRFKLKLLVPKDSSLQTFLV